MNGMGMDINAIQTERLIVLLCVIIGILVIVCLFSFLKLFIIRKNLRQVKQELERTREKDYDAQIRVTLNDKEIEGLAKEINRNLDHQKSLKLKEEAARKQMEQSVADIAHDLRTPLTVVKGNLQMLSAEQLSPEGRQYLEVSSRKAETLKNMVDEFFELSVLESDTQAVALQRIDIVSFLAQFIIDHETLIREKGLTPEITFPEKSVVVNANEELLGRVFSNLLANICKYAKDSFKIQVSEEDGAVTISNRISESDAIDTEHIFERTYRADKARREGSAGLGLYIARLLMKKQKGEITAAVEDGEIRFTLLWL